MPIVVMKLIFQVIPQRTPFFLRPIANLLLGGITKAYLDPQIKTNGDFVRQPCYERPSRLSGFCLTVTDQVEAHLSKSQSGWFANGNEPTSADFQMYFALEALVSRSDSPLPKVKGFLDKVHER